MAIPVTHNHAAITTDHRKLEPQRQHKTDVIFRQCSYEKSFQDHELITEVGWMEKKSFF